MDNGEGRNMAVQAPAGYGTNCPQEAGSEPGSSELYVRKRREMKRVI